MKSFSKIILVLFLGAVLVFIFARGSGNREKKLTGATRLEVRRQGFKTDLADFNFSTPPASRSRETALLSLTNANGLNFSSEFLSPIGANAAEVIWQLPSIEIDFAYPKIEDWSALRASLDQHRTQLDAAVTSILSGPIQFNLEANRGAGMLLRHLSEMRKISQTLAHRAFVALHDHDKDSAWRDILAATRLVTAWEPESTEISYLVRYSLTTIAYEMTWQVLQEKSWTDDQLAQLQREWDSVNFFHRAPDVIAFNRASMVSICQRERDQSLFLGIGFKTFLTAPRDSWAALTSYWKQKEYRHHGSYEDERALLLFYRNREIELSNAVKSTTWLAMRSLPGVTNSVPFTSKYSSRTMAMINLRQIGASVAAQGRSFLAKAAEAETRRQIILSALALERYRVRHVSYPKTLEELSPELLKTAPVDFMDGQPLRYRTTPEGNFVLYSVGLDCADDHGKLLQPSRRPRMPMVFGMPIGNDLVWPRPASAGEMEKAGENRIKEQVDEMQEFARRQAEAWWNSTAGRQAGLERLLYEKANISIPEISFRGRLLSNFLQNTNSPNTNRLSLAQMLTPKIVGFSNAQETVLLEVPIAYDRLTNIADLQLYVDPIDDDDFDSGARAWMFASERATNGNCLIVWRTMFEPPGKHALQVGLALHDPTNPNEDISGPLVLFDVSNLFQLSSSSDHYDPQLGATFHIKLPERRADYRIELISTNNESLIKFEGQTTNGMIEIYWDLKDEHGRKFPGDFFDEVFHITLPESGRTQTLHGP